MSDMTLTAQTEDSDEELAEVAEKISYTLDSDRAFFRNDYIRAAKTLRRTRHVRYDAETPKPAAAQVVIDAMADAQADVFQADADANPIPGVAGFDRDAFMAGTLL